MRIIETAIPGCYEIFPQVTCDDRGTFVKTYHVELFAKHGLNTEWREEYYSVSHKNVLRGLHFQLPPHDHAKLVYCTVGSVLDVVVDLRANSSTYGQHACFELSADKAGMIYIPRGLAHGFYVTSDAATMHYKVATVYTQSHDTGVLWNSAGIKWPVDNPVLSQRDRSFPALQDFVSPF